MKSKWSFLVELIAELFDTLLSFLHRTRRERNEATTPEPNPDLSDKFDASVRHDTAPRL